MLVESVGWLNCNKKRHKNDLKVLLEFQNTHTHAQSHNIACNYGGLFDFGLGGFSKINTFCVTGSICGAFAWHSLFAPCPKHNLENKFRNDEQWKKQSVTWTKRNSFLIRFDLLSVYGISGFVHESACYPDSLSIFWCESEWMGSTVRQPQNMSENTESHLMNNVSIIISCPDNELIPSA